MKIYLVVREFYNMYSCDYTTKITPCLTEEAAKRKLRESIKDELMFMLHAHEHDYEINCEDLANDGLFKYDAEEKHYKPLKNDLAHLHADFEIKYGPDSFTYHSCGVNSCIRIEEKIVEE